MDVVKIVCPKCGTCIEAQSNNKPIYCSFCGAKLVPDDKDIHNKVENKSSGNVKNEIQKKNDTGIPKKKTNIVILVLLWISFFPIMATMALVKSKTISKKGKIIAITSFWGFACVCCFIYMLTNNVSNSTGTNSTTGAVLAVETTNETSQQGLETELEETKKAASESEHETADDAVRVLEKESTESTESAEPELIKEKTYHFVDADYMLNGILIHIESITLKQALRPSGYYIYVSYSVENQNHSDANFAFSSLDGNCVKYNGSKTMLPATATWDRIHTTNCSLQANEKREQLIGDFYVLSESYSKTISGIKYDPINIDELYTGQDIIMDFLMHGYVGNTVEDMTVTFEIRL